MENHIIWLEPFLKYNLGPFSWLYERSRPIVGKIYGAAGDLCSTPGLLALQICWMAF